MRQVALLGSPVEHSLSPAIQRVAFELAGPDWRYEAIETVPEALPAMLARMRAEGWSGANVTIPLKQAVAPLLDELDPSAVLTAAVNTIVNRGGHLIGHNTDLPGFVHDLSAHWQPPNQGLALILGAGGAARAVAFGLLQYRLALCLIARTVSRAEALAEELQARHQSEVTVRTWTEDSFQAAAHQCVLVVNATPVGMFPNLNHSPWPLGVPLPASAFVYDLVYTPKDTALVRRAMQSDLRAVSGGGMLVEQGAISYERWTGLRAPRSRMRAALDTALEQVELVGEVDPDLREV